jgi:hypothetical protein
MRAQCNGALCIACHGLEVIAEQLYANRRAGCSAATPPQFRTDVIKHPVRINTITHPYEFRDNPVKAALRSDQAAEMNIGEPFHWGENNAHVVSGVLREDYRL